MEDVGTNVGEIELVVMGKNKHISLEGTIVLLNSVLNSIPIFHLSVFKMPVTVLKIKEAKISDLSRTQI